MSVSRGTYKEMLFYATGVIVLNLYLCVIDIRSG